MVLRVLELTYTSEEMAGVANGLGYQGPPYVWDDPLHCFCSELDAVFTGMYGLKRFDLANYGLFWLIMAYSGQLA